MRLGMKQFLARTTPHAEVVGETGCPVETLRLTRDLHPDFAVLDPDFGSPDGPRFELCRELKALPEPPIVVIYTHHQNPEGVAAAVLAGADAYVDKALKDTELEYIKDRIAAGQKVILPGASVAGSEGLELIDSLRDKLPPRQRQTFELLLKRRTNAEIASKIYVTQQTAKNYVSAVFKQCGVGGRLEFYEKFCA